MILDKIFGEDGLMHAENTICFEEKAEDRVHWAVYLQTFRQVLPEKTEDLDAV